MPSVFRIQFFSRKYLFCHMYILFIPRRMNLNDVEYFIQFVERLCGDKYRYSLSNDFFLIIINNFKVTCLCVSLVILPRMILHFWLLWRLVSTRRHGLLAFSIIVTTWCWVFWTLLSVHPRAFHTYDNRTVHTLRLLGRKNFQHQSGEIVIFSIPQWTKTKC